MRKNPFTIFKPYVDQVDIRFFDKSDQLTNDDDLAGALGSDQLCTLKQVHGALTVDVTSPSLRTQEADGMITSNPDLWLGIRIADCQSLVFYAPRRQVGGLLHVGWRGLRGGGGGAIPGFFQAIEREHGVPPEELLVGIGPSLCQSCAEFSDPPTELPGISPRFFDGKHVDLRGIADQQLMD